MVYSNLIAGEWRNSGATVANVNPSDTTDVIGEYACATVSDVEEAIAAAAKASSAWGRTTPIERADILHRAAREIEERHTELTDLLAREEGKTLSEAAGEVSRAAKIFRYYGEQAVSSSGDSIISAREGLQVYTSREPVGTVAVITPWNFPIAIPAWKIAPALAFGNTVVFKPADLVPASAWHLTDILHRAGVPAGVLNLVMGRGSLIGDTLTGSVQIDAVSFTGSMQTGQRVLASAQSHMAKVQLEMGGKNPLIIADDADIDVAVAVALESAFGQTGQRCTAASRLIVMDKIHVEFLDRIIERSKSIVVGDARDGRTQMGPVVSNNQLENDLSYLAIARSEGAEVIGGECVEGAALGHYLTPAVVVGSMNHHRINTEEVFGPVAAVLPVGSYDEAVAVANDTRFGLSSGIVTQSLARAEHFRRSSEAGMVMVNAPTAGVDFHAPFGGRKASSYGYREQGEAAQEFYTSIKTSYIAAGKPQP
ncbi:aldehyde dehydrogenase family protein [Nocardia sp. NPDC059246]|uniref:aldehyde dehydrogenase family protein n=1 Tax=unclassified Nocardia TaxID=2637762 RepID=UPI0036ACEB5A